MPLLYSPGTHVHHQSAASDSLVFIIDSIRDNIPPQFARFEVQKKASDRNFKH
jgi:hypothetical protein